jgi:two-component system, LytTR family, sensor kinase
LAWVILAAYTILGLLFASQVRVDYMYAGHELTWRQAAGAGLANWYLWALLTPAIAWFARRFPLTRARWPVSLAVHVPAGIVCGALKVTADAKTAAFFTGARRPDSVMPAYVALLTYWVIVGAVHSLDHYRKYRERELQAAQLKTALARAQVQSLRMQIHPHFLFNTLNAIASLMRENVEAADVMIARFGDLLRVTLATADVPDVPLRQELEFVRMYLDIQQERIGDRLTTTFAAGADTLDAAVPTLLLLPIVENAIRHGAGARPGPAAIAIRASRADGRLTIEVEDDGPGPGDPVRDGHGLRNTRMRLEAAFGSAATLALTRTSSGGALARVTMPVTAPTHEIPDAQAWSDA